MDARHVPTVVGNYYRIVYNFGTKLDREAVLPFMGAVHLDPDSPPHELAFNARPQFGTQTFRIEDIVSIELVSPRPIYMERVLRPGGEVDANERKIVEIREYLDDHDGTDGEVLGDEARSALDDIERIVNADYS